MRRGAIDDKSST